MRASPLRMARRHDGVTPAPLLELRGIEKRFATPLDLAARLARRLGAEIREDVVHAVVGRRPRNSAGEVVGLVGESGCGKSTLGRVAGRAMAPSAGAVLWHGSRPRRARPCRRARAARLGVQMIFQDPSSSLNPRMRVRDIVGEAPAGARHREALKPRSTISRGRWLRPGRARSF